MGPPSETQVEGKTTRDYLAVFLLPGRVGERAREPSPTLRAEKAERAGVGARFRGDYQLLSRASGTSSPLRIASTTREKSG